jgi:hypothetical protein
MLKSRSEVHWRVSLGRLVEVSLEVGVNEVQDAGDTLIFYDFTFMFVPWFCAQAGASTHG